VDNLNILSATRLAMEEAVFDLLSKLKNKPKKQIYIITDGKIKLNLDYALSGIIKGDAKSKTIACASILAKVMRDRIMNIYDKVYPQYGFSQHKGYPTKLHRRMLEKFGPSEIHRLSFIGVKNGV